jgi:two-component system chemotaxis response regulator CheB
MRQRGAVTVGQDEASCAVYGMPAAAAAAGAVEHVLPLDQIAATILHRRRAPGRPHDRSASG